MKKIYKALIGCVLVIACMVAYCLYQAQSKLDAMDFKDIDMREVKDGTYQGSCDAFLVKASVEVTILNHQIQNIDLLQHDNGLGSAAEAILPIMIEKNSSNVDVIASATISSKTIRCAVENALSK